MPERAVFLPGGTPPGSREVEILLNLCRVDISPDSAATVRGLITKHHRSLDWPFLLHQAHLHRIIASVAHNMERLGLFADDPDVPGSAVPIPEAYRGAYWFAHHRFEALMRELYVILEALHSEGIRVVVRKGPTLAEEVYRPPATRDLRDFDLLVDEQDVQRLQSVLSELGYAAGTLSRDNRRLMPRQRKEIIHHRLHVAALPPYIKVSTDPYVEAFQVDARSRLLEPITDRRISTSELLERARPAKVAGAPALALHPEDMLIDLATHLYREATSSLYIAAAADLRLCKFRDVAEYVLLHGGSPLQVAHRVSHYGVNREVFYALHFTDQLFPGLVAPELLDALRPTDCRYLEEYGVPGRRKAAWTAPFRTRLFIDRRHLMEHEESSRL